MVHSASLSFKDSWNWWLATPIAGDTLDSLRNITKHVPMPRVEGTNAAAVNHPNSLPSGIGIGQSPHRPKRHERVVFGLFPAGEM